MGTEQTKPSLVKIHHNKTVGEKVWRQQLAFKMVMRDIKPQLQQCVCVCELQCPGATDGLREIKKGSANTQNNVTALLLLSPPRAVERQKPRRKYQHNRGFELWKTTAVCVGGAAEAKAAQTRLGAGMASRQGGSFNSSDGRRKSPVQRTTESGREQLTAAVKHTTIPGWELTFLAPGRPTAPGCLCLWGTWLSEGGRRLLALYFRYFICQIIATLSRTATAHDSNPETQPSLGRRGKRRAGARLTRPAANESAPFVLRSASCRRDVPSCDVCWWSFVWWRNTQFSHCCWLVSDLCRVKSRFRSSHCVLSLFYTNSHWRDYLESKK